MVGITAHKKGLVLVILRFADELRKPETYFDKIDAKPKPDAVQLAVELIEEHSGKFEPQKMPNEYAEAIHELRRWSSGDADVMAVVMGEIRKSIVLK